MSAATRRRSPASAAARRAAAGVRAAGSAVAALAPAAPARWRARAALALALAAVLAAAWLGLVRDSPLVQVEKVRVVGVRGPEAAAIRAALTEAARNMTTLHVRRDELREAMAPYPTVTGIEADARFPDTLVITVREQLPVGVVRAGARRAAVTPDGRLLAATRYARKLPAIGASIPPGTDRIEGGRAAALLAVLAAAPGPMLDRIRDARVRPRRGIVLRLRSGPDLVFGDASRVRAKWIAATRVLASQSARGATYIDVRLPERPAAGGLVAGTGTDPTAPAAPTGGPPAAAPAATPSAPAAPVVPEPPAAQTPPTAGAPEAAAPGTTGRGGPAAQAPAGAPATAPDTP